jgi:hypothetical protein
VFFVVLRAVPTRCCCLCFGRMWLSKLLESCMCNIELICHRQSIAGR